VPRRPDIVVIMTDQQRHDQVGYRSDGFFETPHLDALAARGVAFHNAYSAAATCIPARIGLLTGMQPRRLPTQPGTYALREGVWTIAHAMRAAGYDTALVGKMHFTPVHADHGFDTMRTSEHVGAMTLGLRPDGAPDLDDYHQWLVDQGVATWGDLTVGAAPELVPRRPADAGGAPFPYRLELHATTWVVEEVNRLLTERRSDRPLFLVVSFPHPHTPLNPLGPYATRYAVTDTPVPRPGYEANQGLPDAFREAIDSDGAAYVPWRVHEHGEEALRTRQTRVRALISQIDDALGILLARFPLDRTVVAFTSDHGDYAGHRGLAGKSPWIPFDDLVRVPLVLAGAGIAGGRRSDALVQSCDLPLTLCELAGVPLPLAADEFDSCSLTPHLGASPPDGLGDRTARFLLNAGWPGARRGRMKLVCHWPSWSKLLFDLERDPEETVDRSGDPDYAAVLADLESVVWDGLLETPPPEAFTDWVATADV
jgi:choline-sulfatase